MRTTLLTILPVLAFFSLPGPSPGGWGGRSCGPVGPSAFSAPIWSPPAAPVLQGWQPDRTQEEVPCWTYYVNGNRSRTYVPSAHTYWVAQAGRWVEQDVPEDLPALVRPAEAKKHCKCGAPCCKCKEPCPCKSGGKPCCPECKCKPKPKDEPDVMPPAAVEQEEPPTGVDSSKLKKDGQERFIIDGKQVSKQQYMQLMAGGQIPDDATKLRLTIIGSEADRGAVLKDLAGAAPLSAWAGKFVVQDYAPSDWAVSNAGFVTGGKPTIYLQQPDGKVLFRLDQYNGPQELAEVIRKSDPNYKPDQDPNGKPKPTDPVTPAIPATLLWGAGGVALALLLSRKR